VNVLDQSAARPDFKKRLTGKQKVDFNGPHDIETFRQP
jgi:hypothetical protein